MDISILITLGIATGIGALIGAERERDQDQEKRALVNFSGLRTYTLISILGWMGAYASQHWGPALLCALLITVALFMLVNYWREAKLLNSTGITSKISALVTFLIGAVALTEPFLSAAIGIITVLILALKEKLHNFVRALSREEFFAAIKFTAVAGIILPLLPRQPIDPWGIIVPFEAWLMVVFVSAISFTGYVLTKLFGPKHGLQVTGILGGLASSTATTTSMAQQSKQNHSASSAFVFAVVAASGMMFLRVGLEVFVVNRSLLPKIAVVLGSMVLATLLVMAFFFWRGMNKKKAKSKDLKLASPFQLGPALKFGAFYIIVLIAAEFAQKYLGSSGVYLASAASGLADVDAITISLGNLASKGEVLADTAIRGIMIAVFVNTFVKLAIVRIFGGKLFFKKVLPAFGIVLLAGIVSVFLV